MPIGRGARARSRNPKGRGAGRKPDRKLLDEYQKIVREITIFCFGSGAIIGLFTAFLRFVMFDGTGNVDWQNRIHIGLFAAALILIATGCSMLTKSRAALVVSMIVGFAGAFASLPLVLFCFVATGFRGGAILCLPVIASFMLGIRSNAALSKSYLAQR